MSTTIAQLHAQGRPGVICLTGGGTQLLSDLLSVPGASRTVLGGHIPYSGAALEKYLGAGQPTNCSLATAVAMAERACQEAEEFTSERPVWGLSCTAALASDRPKRGLHRAHLAYRDSLGKQHARTLVLAKEARTRAEEEKALSRALYQFLLECQNLMAEPLWLPTVPPGFFVQWGDGRRVSLAEDHSANKEPKSTAVVPPHAILSGSFRPLHQGHRELAEAGARLANLPPAFELSRMNVDKPEIDNYDLDRRLNAFTGYAPVFVTDKKLFADKARLFPGSCFIVGVDTALRIVNPAYANHSVAERDAHLSLIQSCGCRFLVAGRINPAGVWEDLNDVPVPAAFRKLFEEIPASAFRVDISSTQLRRRVS